MTRAVFFVTVLLAIATRSFAAPGDYFAIRVVDEATGRGVPLVYLRTTFESLYVTDSAGYVAFAEPGIMDRRDVWFEVRSYGYETPKGAFDVEGVKLRPTPGGSATIKLKRTQIAERLYRITGYGIYRDSVLLGRPAPIQQPILTNLVTGQDTIQTAVYRGKMFWLWGDTDQLGFGLGNFDTTVATTAPPEKLDPERGFDFTYFTDKPDGFVRKMVELHSDKKGPIWIDGLTVVSDDRSEEKLLGRYALVDGKMRPQEAGLVLYDDRRDLFVKLKPFENVGEHQPTPNGHPIRVRDGETTYIYYPNNVRVEATFAAASDPSRYEGFTCLKPDGKVDRKDGRPAWKYVRGARPVDMGFARELVKNGTLRDDESPYRIVDVETNKRIEPAGGSVAWNEHLHRWTLLFGQRGGESFLGEIYFATAASPEGPWTAARKVATHAMKGNDNDLYNPIQHEYFARGSLVYFEGTFVNTFSNNDWPTPYYNYNNLMYRVDLNDPRMKLPDPLPGYTSHQPAR